MLEPDERGYGIIDALIRSDGSGMIHLHQKAGGSRLPASAETVAARLHYVHQEGAAVYKFAIAKMAEVSAEIMARNNLRADMIDWLVPHQANKRIIESTAERMGLPMDRVMVTIHKYGNTTNATIPLCLWDYEPRLRRGDRMVFAAFGGGFTWAGLYAQWSYDGAAASRSNGRSMRSSETGSSENRFLLAGNMRGCRAGRPRAIGRPTICASRSVRSRGASRRYRAGADDRSSASGPRSSPSTVRSSRPCARPRTAR